MENTTTTQASNKFSKPPAYKNTTTSQINKPRSTYPSPSSGSGSSITVSDGFFSHLGKALFGE
tara:strand:- start:54 stop:242 length:189 start_codon:yes stop_codon:yes gene_type:complete